MQFDSNDRQTLRQLARQVADIADHPEMRRRENAWTEHNSLRSKHPMMLVFPEGSWAEILPDSVLKCRSADARGIEWQLRMRIHIFEHFKDDNVIGKDWLVGKQIHHSSWGLEPRRIASPTARGAWHFDPVIKEAADLKKLTFPEARYDEASTMQNLIGMQELFGDVLNVKLVGMKSISYHLMSQYTALRGLEEVMVDMIAEPQMLHEAMAFLTEGHKRLLKQYTEMNLLAFNNDAAYHSSGGNGFTDELPKPDANPDHARPCDMWSSAESQELAQVSPEHHAEFALKYEKQLLEPFGLNGYGCCEDLTLKLDDVLTIPQIRRISCSPWANVEACSRRLKGGYIFSWKPHPAHLVGDFNTGAIRKYLRAALAITNANDCVFEMVLKDTHTCDNHPERFDEWTRIAREEIRAVT